MQNPEEFTLPPEGDGNGKRNESADLDIKDLKAFIEDTQFENVEAVSEILTKRYDMGRREGESTIDLGMTSMMRRPTTEELERMMKGEVIDSDFGLTPVSGIKPELVLHTMVKMTDSTLYDLQIFKVYNRNQAFRFEYVLNQA